MRFGHVKLCYCCGKSFLFYLKKTFRFNHSRVNTGCLFLCRRTHLCVVEDLNMLITYHYVCGTEGTCLHGFSSNSEAIASELLENLDGMLNHE